MEEQIYEEQSRSLDSVGLREVLVAPQDLAASGDPQRGVSWQFLSLTLDKTQEYGFGIGISGGNDNPHFVSSTGCNNFVILDTSIIVSDVLPGGPAVDLVRPNDRIVSVNGISLENVSYSTAVNVMKNSDHLNMIVKRRVPIPYLEYEQRTLKFTLSKTKKKDDFGIVLGCKFYIKEINNPKLAEKEPGLKENDSVLRVNGQSLEGLTLEEASRLLHRSRDKLSLVVQRDVKRGEPGSRWSSQNTVYERLGSMPATPRQSPVPTNYAYHNEHGHMSRRDGAELMKRYSDQGPDYFSRKVNGSQAMRASQVLTARTSSQTPSTCSSPRLNHFPVNYAPHPEPPPTRVIETVVFRKGGNSLGIRVIGGNQVGIFVSAVQEGSPAAKNGLRVGDRIHRVNREAFKGKTRENAVETLLNLDDEVLIEYERCPEDFYLVHSHQLGDSFYIRPQFSHHKKTTRSELTFSVGDIFHVTDTLHNGSVGFWQVQKVYSSGDAELRPDECQGIIPNLKTAESLARQSAMDSSTLSRSLFRKKAANKPSREDDCGTHPAYERVVLKKPAFKRPVIFFGPLADIARQLLVSNFSPYFGTVEDESAVRVASINKVIEADKHCVLNLCPESAEKLQAAQYAPIVILIDVDSRNRIRELRSKAGAATVSARKLMEQAAKVRKQHSHLLTATLDALKEDGWFDALRMLIAHLQERRVWIPETPSAASDDIVLVPQSTLSDGDDTSRSDYGALEARSPAGSSHAPNAWANKPDLVVVGGANHRGNGIYDTTEGFPDELAEYNWKPLQFYNKRPSEYARREIATNADDNMFRTNGQKFNTTITQPKPTENVIDNNNTSNGVPFIDGSAPSDDKGIKVIDEVYAVMDRNGGTVLCPESGVQLILPTMAIPVGRQEKLFVKVFEEPNENAESLLSPVVMCGPQGLKFNRPIELRLPFHGDANSGPSNQFVLKTGTGNVWRNIELLEPPVQNTEKNNISVFIDHF